MNAWRYLGFALVVGCGPTDSGGTGGSGGAEGSGASGPGTGETTATLDGGSSGDSVCEDLLPARSAPVMLRVRNDRAEAIFIDNAGCGPSVRITSGGERTRWQFPGCNLAPCDGVLSGECGIACGDCADGILRISPGGVYEQLWDGGVFVDAQAPEQCAMAGCELECHQEVPIPAATYELATDIFLTCPLDDPGLCDCAGGEQDACAIFTQSTVAGDAMPVSVVFDYPAQTTAEIVVAP